jgi:serine/threonine-protein kinase RsbW
MSLDSALDSVESIEQAAESFALRAGFDEDTASQIAMVSREAGVNAVLHGNKKDPNKCVRAEFELTDEALTIKIADEGEGLDPDAIPDPLAPENILKPSGRGVFLMRAIMDEVEFRRLAPGTEITLVKRRAEKGETRMSIHSTSREVDGVTILDISGKITLGAASAELRGVVTDTLSKGAKKIVLNLADVGYVDSAGLGELVSAYTTVKNAGGTLKLLKLTKKVSDLMVITKLVTVFETFDDEAAAVASFK